MSKMIHQQQNKINDLQVKITDLEAKLAESKTAIIDLTNTCDKWADKYINLQKQLVEKEKEIDEINREFVQSTHDWKEIVDEKIKAKTEFAIEKLKMVKEIIQFKPPMQTYEEIIKTFMFRIDEIIKELEEV